MRSLLATLLFVPLAAAAQAPAQETLFNLVTLNTQAEREVPNDLMIAVLAAEAEGPDAAKLSDAVNRSMQRALETAKGHRSVSARSGNYQTWPVSDKEGRRWRVRQELRLESQDFDTTVDLIGKLQSTLVVSSMSVTVSPGLRRKMEDALIAEAVAAFEDRARIVRDAMKAKGYRIRDLQLSGGGQYHPVAMMSAARVAAPAVEAGSSRVVITASGTIQLQ